MHAMIDGRWIDFSRYEYFGGIDDDGNYEDLYRTPDRGWLLHTRHFVTVEAPTLLSISEEEAVSWLTNLWQIKERAEVPTSGRRARTSVPYWIVPQHEHSLCGREIRFGPPLIGQHTEWVLPERSPTGSRIEDRQKAFLQPGTALEDVMRPRAADIAATARFREERHDPLLARLQTRLEIKLVERPHIAIIQNRQDRGCDLVIDWPMRVKYGVQLKSNGDVEEKDFAGKTVQQIQDSRQHGLTKLFVVLAADITGKSNLEKVLLSATVSQCDERFIHRRRSARECLESAVQSVIDHSEGRLDARTT